MHRKLIFISALIFLISCQQAGNEESIKKQISEYKRQVEDLNDKIAKLEKKLEDNSADSDQNYTVPVKVLKLEYGEFKHYIEVGGVVEAVHEAFISPETSGQIAVIYVNEGDRVTKGQLLLELNSDITRSQIDELQNSLDYASVVYEKQKRLWDQHIGSEMQYLNAKNNVESLQKRLEILNAQLEMSRITSPVTGVVDDIYKKEGMILPEPTNKKYSGKFVLRTGSELHKALALKALSEGDSLNSFVIKKLKKIVSA